MVGTTLMREWLSSTWEPSWKSFQYFNVYRLIAAAALVSATLFHGSWFQPFRTANPGLFDWLGVLYILLLGAGTLLSATWQQHFNNQLTLQLLADILAASCFIFAAGGVSSGLGLLLLVSLAAASLVGRGKLVLLYAALSALAILTTQLLLILYEGVDLLSLFQAGLLAAGYFATAILSRLLGQRIMINEELARRRGEALTNEIRISQRVIEQMQDALLVVGRDSCVLRHNPVAEHQLGVSALDGRRLDELSVVLAGHYALWLAERGQGATNFVAPSGKELRARFSRTESSDGEALVLLDDIGRIRQQAQQMKLAALGRLTGNIAHEIRNPLSAINHAGELLREESRAEVQDRLLRILHTNVARLDGIVRDVLELGRSDRIRQQTLDLGPYVQEFIEEFSATERVEPGVIQFEADGKGGIDFDPTHLHQVLWNLTANALRHSRQEAGSVILRLHLTPGEGRIELHCLDDGPGVPPEIGEQVFEPFFTTHHQGTGLGLYITRELCEANGASLELAPSAWGGHFILSGRNQPCHPSDPSAAPEAP